MSTSLTHCEKCGSELVEGRCNRCADKAVTAIVRRDLVRLTILTLIAVVFFFATRSLARWDRKSSAEQASYWYAAGKAALQNQDLAGATRAFRKASTRDRTNPAYALALAESLTKTGGAVEAKHLLFQLREDRPEDPAVNLQLARIFAQENDLEEAERYYHNALYGSWRGDEAANEHQEVHFELASFLLAHDQRGTALSELLAIEAEASKVPANQRRLGDLFLQVGEYQRAKNAFNKALQADNKDAVAMAGLTQANFHLGLFDAALRSGNYALNLSQQPAGDLGHLVDVLQWIKDNDPTAHGLPRPQRYRRLSADIDHARQRIDDCLLAPTITSSQHEDLQSLKTQMEEFQRRMKKSNAASQDDITDGFALIRRGVASVDPSCSAPTLADEALAALVEAKAGKE